MQSSFDDSQPRQKKDWFPLLSNLGLLLFGAAFLWVAFARYHDRLAAISLNESKFITTEWRLLQELKSQTDQELLQKDQEIADLNRRYLLLIRNNASPPQVAEVRQQLNQARAERNQILSRSIPPPPPEPATIAAGADSLAPASTVTLTALLQKRITALQTQLDDGRLIIRTLERSQNVGTGGQTSAQSDLAGIEKDRARISELSETVSRLTSEISSARAELGLKLQSLNSPQVLGLEELDTRALVRALISTPEARAAYPGLLESFDRFLQRYGERERLNGQAEAYAAAEGMLGSDTGN